MRHLVYCILRARPPWRGRLPEGVEGTPIVLVTEDALAAAVSRVSELNRTADAARATAYAAAIAVLLRRRTVLPMRYGCLLPSETQVHEFLRVRRAEFGALLDQVDGCVEMGVRVLLATAGRPVGDDGGRTNEVGSGVAYLAARRAAYACRDAERETVAAARSVVERTFSGLSVQSRATQAVIGPHVLMSLYFLIRRGQIGAFRGEFRRLQERVGYRLLVSGPWAPYSFVAPQETEVVS